MDQRLPHIQGFDGISAFHKKIEDVQEDVIRNPVHCHLDYRGQSAVVVDTTKTTYDDLVPD